MEDGLKEKIIELIKTDPEFCLWILSATEKGGEIRCFDQIKQQRHEEGLSD